MPQLNPTYILGANFGPYETESYRVLVQEYLAKAEDVCFRDEWSKEKFPELSNIRFAPDIVLGIKKITERDVKKKKTGRCLLLGMCASTELGGNITPLGSSINIMVINFLNDCGFSISYAKWIGISLPLFVILFFLMTRILFRMCPPEALSQPKIQECIAANQTLRPLSAKEKKLLAIVSVMMVLLLISPFIPELKSELIIVAAGILLMLPGIEVVKYDQLAKSEAFTQTIYICCFIGLAGILSSAGVVDVLTAGFQSMMPSRPSVFIVVALLCVLTIVLCNFLPAAAVPSVLTVPMITFCASVNIDPVLAVIPLAMCSNCS